MEIVNKILVLAMGNDIMGDDGVSLEAAKHLKDYYGDNIIIEDVFGGGFELLDYMEGKEKVLIIDSISTGKHEQGTIMELSEREFHKIEASSPHYVGLPEVIKISKLLNIDFPSHIKILAVETKPQLCLKEGLSPCIENSIPELVNKAKTILDEWIKN
ncbi:MAG: hydrogenase maturation protease [FCB group bacterium]|jgi:hydrogenase maturation protease